MRFGDKFRNYVKPEAKHSIGVELHYNNGPTTLDLYACAGADATTCTVSKGSLENSGTLRIAMKAPSGENVCDWHVRAAYPQMPLLLDDTDLRGGNNKNQDKAYIDVPVHIDPATGNGKYNPKCFDCDFQNPDQSNCDPAHPVAYHATVDIKAQLDAIVESLGQVKVDQEPLLVAELRSEAKSVGDRFPKFSELERLEQLLSRSTTEIGKLLLVPPAQEQAGADHARAATASNTALLVILQKHVVY